MESLQLVKTSKPRLQPSEQRNKADLIRLWLGKLSVNAGQALSPTALGVFEAIWQEGFEDLPYSVLEAAFTKALRTCKFWPVKVADIRENVDRVHETAVSEAADLEWQRVLDLRRGYWSPDMPGGFSRGMPKLSERVQQAARAAGVFRDFDSTEGLHVWAKKRFVESYLAWEELEQDQFLLADGELKNLLAGAAETKALPAPKPETYDLHKHGLEYAKAIKEKSMPLPEPKLPPENRPVIATRERLEELARQAEQMKAKYQRNDALLKMASALAGGKAATQ